VLHKELHVFPSDRLSVDPRSGAGRYYLDENELQKAVRRMAQRASNVKPVGPHTSRRCFATQLLVNHCRIRIVQELLCHKHVNKRMIYTHVLSRGGLAVRSPLD